MPALGTIVSTTDVPGKAVRSGTVALIITDLTKLVSFSSALPSANYRVFLAPEGNLGSVAWPSAKSTTGFTINLSAGVVGNYAYLAIED